jgi:hypothetical protein
MLAEKQVNTNIGVGVGFVLQATGRILTLYVPGMSAAGIALTIVGTGLFIWGCVHYAQGKGYHSAFGLLGLLSIFGLVALALLPDKHRLS